MELIIQPIWRTGMRRIIMKVSVSVSWPSVTSPARTFSPPTQSVAARARKKTKVICVVEWTNRRTRFAAISSALLELASKRAIS